MYWESKTWWRNGSAGYFRTRLAATHSIVTNEGLEPKTELGVTLDPTRDGLVMVTRNHGKDALDSVSSITCTSGDGTVLIDL